MYNKHEAREPGTKPDFWARSEPGTARLYGGPGRPGDIHKGVTTRSRVAHFCELYSFVSSIEPYRVEDALRDSEWVLAMQEELNNFTRNEVWHLLPRPNQNVVGTKWVFRNKQDEHGVVTGTKPDLWPRDIHKSKVWILVKPMHP
jgi:hypothetical protein